MVCYTISARKPNRKSVLLRNSSVSTQACIGLSLQPTLSDKRMETISTFALNIPAAYLFGGMVLALILYKAVPKS